MSNGQLATGNKTLSLSGPEGVVLLAFRTAAIEGRKVRRASVLLHLLEEKPPGQIDVALVNDRWSEYEKRAPASGGFVTETTKPKQQRWCSFPLPPGYAQSLGNGKASGIAVKARGAAWEFHSRAAAQWSPFLLVEVAER